MSDSELVDLALRLWPQVRDHGTVDNPDDLDRLIDAQGLPGAPAVERGLLHTFACFAPDAAAVLALPTGERMTRTLLGAGLAVDERVAAALTEAHALSWVTSGGGNHHQSAVALAVSLWLIALDPLSDSDRPLSIPWGVDLFNDVSRWDPDERLFSHYDVRERALDWAAYVSYDGSRHAGVSRWTIMEPLLRMERDDRARLALSQFFAADDSGEPARASAMLERNRIAGLMRAWSDGGDQQAARPPWASRN
jgi:hypothetical protein